MAPPDVARPDPLPGHGRAPVVDAPLSHGHVVRWRSFSGLLTARTVWT
jgi:hypothetical protein